MLNPGNLYPILWAADNFSAHEDPPLRINEYLVANSVFTPNIRNDSGQPDAWRDYQQILSELGLIYSTEIARQITLTALGIAYLDKLVSFSELMVLQTFRYQYPNGHKIVMSSSLRTDLEGSPFAELRNLVEVQIATNVLIRPAVLIWQIVRNLSDVHRDQGFLTFDEIRNYVMRCTNHSDTLACVESILQARAGNTALPAVSGSRGKRNMQDWIKFLTKTPLYSTEDHTLKISYDGNVNAANIDSICATLATTKTFWSPGNLDKDDRAAWYSFYGSVDLELELNSQINLSSSGADETATDDSEEDIPFSETRSISLQVFNEESLRGLKIAEPRGSATIDVSYDAEIADLQHRLHDRMVVLIGSYFKELGASVFFDPKTVDVLVKFSNFELLIEVKSATSKNIMSKVRSAIGQICYYDYLRSKETSTARRRMIALTAKVPESAWYIDFLNNHLDIDLISLNGQDFKIFTPSDIVSRLNEARV